MEMSQEGSINASDLIPHEGHTNASVVVSHEEPTKASNPTPPSPKTPPLNVIPGGSTPKQISINQKGQQKKISDFMEKTNMTAQLSESNEKGDSSSNLSQVIPEDFHDRIDQIELPDSPPDGPRGTKRPRDSSSGNLHKRSKSSTSPIISQSEGPSQDELADLLPPPSHQRFVPEDEDVVENC
jgi:hypothetical protein